MNVTSGCNPRSARLASPDGGGCGCTLCILSIAFIATSILSTLRIRLMKKRSSYGGDASVPLGSLTLGFLDCAYLSRDLGGSRHTICSMCSVLPSIFTSNFLPLLSPIAWRRTIIM